VVDESGTGSANFFGPVRTIEPMARTAGTKLIADNRRARHDYTLLDRFEAGIVLTGTEVKVLRDRRVTLQHAFADVRGTEVYLVGAHIPEYAQGNIANHDPDRDRKLLLHRREIDTLASRVAERGLTVVPTRMYFRDGRVKVEIALARGKDVRDKRRDLADRDARRQIERALKAGRRGE
jgi:SsrA-binding protein